ASFKGAAERPRPPRAVPVRRHQLREGGRPNPGGRSHGRSERRMAPDLRRDRGDAESAPARARSARMALPPGARGRGPDEHFRAEELLAFACTNGLELNSEYHRES